MGGWVGVYLHRSRRRGNGVGGFGGGGIGKLKCKEIKYSIKTGVYDYKNNYI